MKGIIFTSLLEMMEARNGQEWVDRCLENYQGMSQGAFTAVGNYDTEELNQLVEIFSKNSQLSIDTLIYEFGQYMLQVFLTKHKIFFDEHSTCFDFLKSVDNHIHVQVKKLYANANVPKISAVQLNPNTLKVTYESSRNLSMLAHGLISAAIKYYRENIVITEKENKSTEAKTIVYFILKKQ